MGAASLNEQAQPRQGLQVILDIGARHRLVLGQEPGLGQPVGEIGDELIGIAGAVDQHQELARDVVFDQDGLVAQIGERLLGLDLAAGNEARDRPLARHDGEARRVQK